MTIREYIPLLHKIIPRGSYESIDLMTQFNTIEIVTGSKSIEISKLASYLNLFCRKHHLIFTVLEIPYTHASVYVGIVSDSILEHERSTQFILQLAIQYNKVRYNKSYIGLEGVSDKNKAVIAEL